MATDVYHEANGLDGLFEDDDDNDMMDGFDTPAEQGFDLPAAEESNDLRAFLGEDEELGNLDLNEINSRVLDTGEKADDAIDYEDIGDDDSLPDEEPTQGSPSHQISDELPQMPDGGLDDIDLDDDLFGPSSPTLPPQLDVTSVPLLDFTKPIQDEDRDSDLASEHGDEPAGQDLPMLQSELDDIEDAQYRIQLALFAQSGKGYIPLTEQENNEEWLKLEFPGFKKDQTPYFNRLFPPRPVKWVGKTPLKPPKPIRPTKLNLEVEQDQRLQFNSLPGAVKAELNEGLVHASLQPATQPEEESSDESEDDGPLPGGVTMQDLEFMCTDFDTLSAPALSDNEDGLGFQTRIVDSDDDLFDFDEISDMQHPRKRRRLGMDARDVVSIRNVILPVFDDPEDMTAQLARKVILDLNDPALLVEEVDPETIRAKARPGEKIPGPKTIKDRLAERFKTSNDAEYDLLKQNHQHKIRGQLSHLTIDHSTPAIKLQYPYYQVRLPLQELRNWHRKRIRFNQVVVFSKPAKHKKKHTKGKSTKELYGKTKDLSMADNSSVMLLEYSEEHPIMLSQTGMGSKVVNYYRRSARDDTSRPKGDIGDTSVLLPEDKSPFHIFGHIDAGEQVTALYNSMYRAPIFPQDMKPQDFLVLRETTGLHGQHYFLREVENLFVVGQELPSVTVPGTHSRMVTTASKNRLKAISFRIARRKKSHRIRVEDVTRHFPDTSDMQNRQKMKEFMVFSKEHKEWEMKPGEAVPDEDTIQTLIKPEDVCLLESMQVGAQYLADAGYGDDDDEDDTKEKDNDTDSVEQQLAPWRTTKNFIQATQGKAMLKLFGDGDPSGRGEAFSLIKTSMKGGFKAIGGSAQDAITLKKELGGHSYNVARQQRSYEESIRGIWDKQKASLGSHIEPTDLDMDGDVDTQETNYGDRSNPRATPVSSTHTPGPGRRRDDETATSFSRRSITSQSQKVLRIVRSVWKDGEMVDQEHIETDPAVIKQYTKIREAQEANNTSLSEIIPTGDVDYDARQRKRLEEELARLQKNAARRMQRDKTKQALNAGSPGAMSPDGELPTPVTARQVQATQRKCANCGQVGHIKTNKKSVKCQSCYLPFFEKVVDSILFQAPVLAS